MPILKPIVTLLAMALLGVAGAHGQEARVGRYQMVAVPASQSQTFPQTLLLGHHYWADLDPVPRDGAGHSMASPPVFGWNGSASVSLAAVA